MNFLNLILNGLSIGGIYALIAVGIVIVFKATRVLNFAYGSLLFVGAYIVARGHEALTFWGALLLAIVVAGALAWAIDRFLCRYVTGREQVLRLAILTLGVDIILVTEMTRRIGVETLSLGTPWGSSVVSVGPISMATSRLLAIVVAAAILIAFLIVIKKTDWGIRMRASSEDPMTSELMGISTRRVSGSVWIVAGVLAAIAAVFIYTFPSPGLQAGAGVIALRAFPAAMLGGLDSIGGAIIGGLAIGVIESLALGYQADLDFLGRGFASLAPYLLLLAVLMWRPHGLFGTRTLERV